MVALRVGLRRLTMSFSLLVATSCTEIVRGSPCGGTRQVDAQAVLPDTGLGAGGTANISFFEAEPRGTSDDTSLGVWTYPRESKPFADGPPRVRVVTDDGKVFLDRQTIAASGGSWYAREPVPPGSRRDEIITAFQNGAVMVEFLDASPKQKVTRARPIVRFAGSTPVLRCL